MELVRSYGPVHFIGAHERLVRCASFGQSMSSAQIYPWTRVHHTYGTTVFQRIWQNREGA